MTANKDRSTRDTAAQLNWTSRSARGGWSRAAPIVLGLGLLALLASQASAASASPAGVNGPWYSQYALETHSSGGCGASFSHYQTATASSGEITLGSKTSVSNCWSGGANGGEHVSGGMDSAQFSVSASGWYTITVTYVGATGSDIYTWTQVACGASHAESGTNYLGGNVFDVNVNAWVLGSDALEVLSLPSSPGTIHQSYQVALLSGTTYYAKTYFMAYTTAAVGGGCPESATASFTGQAQLQAISPSGPGTVDWYS